MSNKRIKALSLFANVGLAETYFSECGIDVAVANELLPERARFYSHLHPETNMICGDITDDSVFGKIAALSKSEKVDFIIATPPCQGMSCAGKKDPYDERNFLVFYAVKMIKELSPTYVMLENVPMIQHTKIKLGDDLVSIPEYLEHELGDQYVFNKRRVVNAKDYGVPQSRIRYIVLMVKKSLEKTWEFPEPTSKPITLRQAIGHLPELDPELIDKNTLQYFPDFEKKRLAGLSISKWHYPPKHTWKLVEWMIHTPSGRSAFGNNHYFPSKDGRRIKGAPRTYMRMDWDKPATTVMMNNKVISSFSTVHPGRLISGDANDEMERKYSDPRALTIYELLIVSSLPLDWNIPDWANDTLIRKVIGEGVPPLLTKAAVSVLPR